MRLCSEGEAVTKKRRLPGLVRENAMSHPIFPFVAKVNMLNLNKNLKRDFEFVMEGSLKIHPKNAALTS